MCTGSDIINSTTNPHEDTFILLPIEFRKFVGVVVCKHKRLIRDHRGLGIGPRTQAEKGDIKEDDEEDDVGWRGHHRDNGGVHRAGELGPLVGQTAVPGQRIGIGPGRVRVSCRHDGITKQSSAARRLDGCGIRMTMASAGPQVIGASRACDLKKSRADLDQMAERRSSFLIAVAATTPSPANEIPDGFSYLLPKKEYYSTQKIRPIAARGPAKVILLQMESKIEVLPGSLTIGER
jgi:hypothetical protein